MDSLKDAHYFSIPSQGNIYTMVELRLANGLKKLLVSSLKREIFCLEYLDNDCYLNPTIKEISFTYIPSGAEIISMDAFNKSLTKNDFVIGITIIKNNNELDSLESFLNIYSGYEESDEFNIDNIAQNCLNVQLNFIPYKLLHTYLIHWDEEKRNFHKEVVFLLSGSDHLIHAYKEHPLDHIYKELEIKEWFPEFSKTPSPVICIDIYFHKNYSERITAICCECGFVKLTKVCTKSNKLMSNFVVRFTNYISKVLLFTDSHDVDRCDQFQSQILKKSVEVQQKDELHLIVLNTILPGVIFQDVLKYGLSNYFTLPRHESGTTVLTCCEVADIDFDGRKEILIGNSNREIMYIKYNEGKGWCLEDLKKMKAPILDLKYFDICGDGARELIVFSMKGIHILQHDIEHVQRALERKIMDLTVPKVEELFINEDDF